MDFQCFICSQSFETGNDAITHLKIAHSLKDNVAPIQCVFVNCQNNYLSFKALKVHLKNSHKNNVQMVNMTVFSHQISNILTNCYFENYL